MNTLLATTTEVQVVETLNRIRDVWDPKNKWPLYRFDRQAQTFPDVLLRKQLDSGDFDVALGIELKGAAVRHAQETSATAVVLA